MCINKPKDQDLKIYYQILMKILINQNLEIKFQQKNGENFNFIQFDLDLENDYNSQDWNDRIRTRIDLLKL